MTKEQIAEMLQSNHTQFMQQLQQLTDTDFCYASDTKWTAAQQLAHIVKSVTPVKMAMGLPKFIIKWNFGIANRPSRSYADLVEKYHVKLKEGGKASGRFIPAPVEAAQKQKLLIQLTGLVTKLCHKTLVHSEEALDKYILPHPLLGKLTLREMLYFTAYHVEHHRHLVAKELESR